MKQGHPSLHEKPWCCKAFEACHAHATHVNASPRNCSTVGRIRHSVSGRTASPATSPAAAELLLALPAHVSHASALESAKRWA